MTPAAPPPDTAAPAAALDPPPTKAPTLRFMLAHPAHMLSLGFGSGLAWAAPGTWGTLAGWLLFLWLGQWLGAVQFWVLVAVLFVAGALAAQRTGRELGSDAGPIVIDEIVAFWIVLLMLPANADLVLHAVAFVVFRFFDIAKPPPIRWLDARVNNGFGVMLDDLMAAFYTLLVISIGIRVLG